MVVHPWLCALAIGLFVGGAPSSHAQGCPYKGADDGCVFAASADLGDSFCRIDGDKRFPIRELTNEQAFAFVHGLGGEKHGIDITLVSDSGSNACKRNSDLQGDVNFKLTREPGADFTLELTKGSDTFFTPMHSDGITPGRIRWLQGRDPTRGYDYVIYLYDEPGGDGIVKHYRLEAFDKECQSHLPQRGVNILLNSASLKCKVVTKIARQTGSGDGYEPKK